MRYLKAALMPRSIVFMFNGKSSLVSSFVFFVSFFYFTYVWFYSMLHHIRISLHVSMYIFIFFQALYVPRCPQINCVTVFPIWSGKSVELNAELTTMVHCDTFNLGFSPFFLQIDLKLKNERNVAFFSYADASKFFQVETVDYGEQWASYTIELYAAWKRWKHLLGNPFLW